MNPAGIANRKSLAKKWCSRALFAANILLFGMIFIFFSFHRTSFDGQWNGATVSTMALTAATISMAAVTLMVGIIAIWGYATLRAQAENIARETAQDAVNEMKRQLQLISLGRSSSNNSQESETLGYGEE